MFLLLAFFYILGSIRAAPTSTQFPRDTSVLPSFADAPSCVCPTNQRAVKDIIWSCLVTIFACAWVAVHPNIPALATAEADRNPNVPEIEAFWGPQGINNVKAEESPRSTGWGHQVLSKLYHKFISQVVHGCRHQVLGYFKSLGKVVVARWHQALPRLELMAWTIIAPEFMIFWAMRQWKGAHTTVFQWLESGWTPHKIEITDLYPGWTKTHGYFVQMGGFVLYDKDERLRILDSENLVYLLETKKIEEIKCTKQDIEDRSKGDALSKTVVLGQTTWFVAQCISRKAQNLATTELELITLAFAVLNGFMYFFWWDKPLDVSTPVRVYLKLNLTDSEKAEVMEKLELFPDTDAAVTSGPLHSWPMKCMKAIQKRLLDMCVFGDEGDSDVLRPGATHVHIFYATSLSLKDAEQMQATSSVVAVLFGAIHCVGWNFVFPSTAESNLWHVSSLIVTTAPLLMQVRFLLYDPGVDISWKDRVKYVIWDFTVYIALPFYFLARIILILEAILALRDLPPSALATVQWSSFLPHI